MDLPAVAPDKPKPVAVSVADYEQARAWLWRHSQPETYLDPAFPLPPEARLVCDMFWVPPKRLCTDLRADWQGKP